MSTSSVPSTPEPPELSLVVPVYYEEACIDAFIEATTKELGKHHIDYEILFIDDGSKDQTVSLILSAIEKNPRLRLLEFSYNHGKQAAVSAGIAHAQGQWLLYMDPDLQDPPEEIIRFLEKAKSDGGYDLVFSTRKEKHDTFLNTLGSKLFWSILEKFTQLQLPKPLAVMRIFSRRFAQEFLKYQESNRFIEGIFSRVGLKQTSIEIEQRERYAGKSKFNFRRRFQLAIDAILDYSDIPLRMATRLGALLILLGIIAVLSITALKLWVIDFHLGWPSIICVLLIGFGAQIFLMGVIGIYVGKIYLESKRRPLYSIMGYHNVAAPEHS